MLNIFEKLGLPVPSKKDIIFVSTIIILCLVCWKQHKVIQDKEEIINNKNTEIIIQQKTITELDKSYKESSEKILKMNSKLNSVEKDYQSRLDQILTNAGKCKSDTNPTELEKKARDDFKAILDALAYSTKKER